MPDDQLRNAVQVISRSVGGSPMVRNGVIAPAAEAWYVPRPASPDEWRQRASDVRRMSPPGWLGALSAALSASGAAAERLERVAEGRGVVVTTGQQPGLFGGPLFTWWKALTALALADALESATGIPHAPVFWAATDDSDFAEASHTYVAVRGGLERLTLAHRVLRGERMIDIPLGEVEPLIERLEGGAGAAVYPEALEAVRDAYRPHATIGQAFLALLRRMLEPLGVAVIDAAHPAVAAAGEPLLRSALREAAAVERALMAREQEMRAAGFRPQVPLVRGRSLVFATVNGGRERIAIGAPDGLADGAAATLGPNVLLRPVLERTILPTVAYVAGPSEMAYFAQVSAVAAALEAQVPLPVPRWSGTVIEPHVQRLLDRYGLSLEGLADPHAAEGMVAREGLPASVREALGRLRGSTAAPIEALASAVRAAGSPPISDAVLTGVARDVERRLGRLERRVIAAAKREQVAAMTDVATLRAALMPLGKAQERALNLFPLLARHGPAMWDAVRAEARSHAEAMASAHAPLVPSMAAAPTVTGSRERAG